jgi:signal peptidase I
MESKMMQRLIRATVRASWFGGVPLGLAALVVRYGIASPWDVTTTPFEQSLAETFHAYALQLTIAIVLLAALLLRYWQWHLPGAFLLSSLPWSVARRQRRSALPRYEEAIALQHKVQGALGRHRRALSAESGQRIRDALDRLASALAMHDGDVEFVSATGKRLAAEAEPLLSRVHRREAAVLAVGLAASVVLALSARDTIGQVYEVSGSSMLPTLEPNAGVGVKRVITTSMGSGRERAPRRGDVIVFQRDDGEGVQHQVKRVIGLPGDRIQMDGLAPIINGWTVPNCRAGLYSYAHGENVVSGWLRVEFLEERSYLVLFNPGASAFERELVVPEGEVFVLGDNRADSRDSRHYNVGFGGGQPLADIAGRVDFFLWTPGRDGRLHFDRIFRPLGTEIVTESVDVTQLKQGIEACLKQRPANTTPPAPSAGAQAYGLPRQF